MVFLETMAILVLMACLVFPAFVEMMVCLVFPVNLELAFLALQELKVNPESTAWKVCQAFLVSLV